MPTDTAGDDRSQSDPARALAHAIGDRSARIAVVGMGYVGLPLVRAVFGAGFRVIGFDTDASKTDRLARGEAYIAHLGAEFHAQLASSDRFTPTSDPDALAEADAILLCVPTPLGPHREPDLGAVLGSTRTVAQTLRSGQLIVLESTTYPGTTRDEMGPILSEAARARGLELGRDVFLAYSPEREDPGRAGVTTEGIPKLVGGVDDTSSALAEALYASFIERVHRVSSAEVAEAAKLLENIYRAVNIALVNELKVILDGLGIDVWEVIDAAKTKPFGFKAFYPGPGLGGHCIPIDPFYLAWKARESGRATRFIELAGEINREMPGRVVMRTGEALNDEGMALRGARVLILGVAYKPDVDDIRESPAAEIIERLKRMGAEISYHDPHIPVFPAMKRYTHELASVGLTADVVRAADAVVIVTDHAAVDYGLVGREAGLIIDTRNAMAGVAGVRARVVKA